MTSAEFWVLLTDALWTLTSAAGLYYGQGVLRHAGKAYSYSTQALGRSTARRQFALNRRKARYLLTAVLLGTALGVFVVGQDIGEAFRGDSLELDTRRIIYRFALITIMACVAAALRTLWRIYETWGER